jgi:uroporphyrinogen decarboxylase
VADLIEMPGIGGVFMGDDLGFATATIISPKIICEQFLPQTKKIVDLVHEAGKLFVFHSCGNLEMIMDDIIAIGVDGKHSFEDKIMPVEEAYQRWSDRVGIFGGVDMHLLTVGTEEEVRKRTREILDVCGRDGRYMLGTGNSAANYIPLRNYLAMLDEGKKWNREHFPGE